MSVQCCGCSFQSFGNIKTREGAQIFTFLFSSFQKYSHSFFTTFVAGKRRTLFCCKIYFLPISSQYLINAGPRPPPVKSKNKKSFPGSGEGKSNYGRWSKSLFYLISNFFFQKLPLKLIHYFLKSCKTQGNIIFGNNLNQ